MGEILPIQAPWRAYLAFFPYIVQINGDIKYLDIQCLLYIPNPLLTNYLRIDYFDYLLDWQKESLQSLQNASVSINLIVTCCSKNLYIFVFDLCKFWLCGLFHILLAVYCRSNNVCSLCGHKFPHIFLNEEKIKERNLLQITIWHKLSNQEP